MNHSTTEIRWLPLVFVGFLQFALLPVAIGITVWNNDPSWMPLYNEMGWTCVPSAQTALSTLYLAFGAGGLVLRFSLTLVTLVMILLSTGWAYGVIGVFDNPWAELPGRSGCTVVPASLTGLFLSLLRPWIGTVRCTHTIADARCRIQDLLLTTFFVSVLLCWYRYAVSVVSGEPVDVLMLALYSSLIALFGLSCLLLVMGSTHLRRFAGVAGFAIGLTVNVSLFSWSTWFQTVSVWGIVICTLAVLRVSGVCLRRITTATTK